MSGVGSTEPPRSGGAGFAGAGAGMSRERLVVDPIRCDAYGYCAELLPELVSLDEWGYPMIRGEQVPDQLGAEARRAVAACPRLALRLERQRR
jgi:ferredoxin